MKKLLYGATYEDLLSAQKYARAWAPIFGKLFLAIVYLKKTFKAMYCEPEPISKRFYP